MYFQYYIEKNKHALNTIKLQCFMSISFFAIFLLHVFFFNIISDVDVLQFHVEFRNPCNLRQRLRTFSFECSKTVIFTVII